MAAVEPLPAINRSTPGSMVRMKPPAASKKHVVSYPEHFLNPEDPFEHRHYQPYHPTCNKILAKRWEDHTRDIHLMKLRQARPTIDNGQPRVYPHLEMRLKRMQIEEERLRDIERKNHILLDRIAFQMMNPSEVSNLRTVQAPSEGKQPISAGPTPKRKRDMKQISQENLTILQRIEDKAPYYNRLEWLADRKKNLGYLFNIAQYPKTYIRVLEEDEAEFAILKTTTRPSHHKRHGKHRKRIESNRPVSRGAGPISEPLSDDKKKDLDDESLGIVDDDPSTVSKKGSKSSRPSSGWSSFDNAQPSEPVSDGVEVAAVDSVAAAVNVADDEHGYGGDDFEVHEEKKEEGVEADVEKVHPQEDRGEQQDEKIAGVATEDVIAPEEPGIQSTELDNTFPENHHEDSTHTNADDHIEDQTSGHTEEHNEFFDTPHDNALEVKAVEDPVVEPDQSINLVNTSPENHHGDSSHSHADDHVEDQTSGHTKEHDEFFDTPHHNALDVKAVEDPVVEPAQSTELDNTYSENHHEDSSQINDDHHVEDQTSGHTKEQGELFDTPHDNTLEVKAVEDSVVEPDHNVAEEVPVDVTSNAEIEQSKHHEDASHQSVTDDQIQKAEDIQPETTHALEYKSRKQSIAEESAPDHVGSVNVDAPSSMTAAPSKPSTPVRTSPLPPLHPRSTTNSAKPSRPTSSKSRTGASAAPSRPISASHPLLTDDIPPSPKGDLPPLQRKGSNPSSRPLSGKGRAVLSRPGSGNVVDAEQVVAKEKGEESVNGEHNVDGQEAVVTEHAAESKEPTHSEHHEQENATMAEDLALDIHPITATEHDDQHDHKEDELIEFDHQGNDQEIDVTNTDTVNEPEVIQTAGDDERLADLSGTAEDHRSADYNFAQTDEDQRSGFNIGLDGDPSTEVVAEAPVEVAEETTIDKEPAPPASRPASVASKNQPKNDVSSRPVSRPASVKAAPAQSSRPISRTGSERKTASKPVSRASSKPVSRAASRTASRAASKPASRVASRAGSVKEMEGASERLPELPKTETEA